MGQFDLNQTQGLMTDLQVGLRLSAVEPALLQSHSSGMVCFVFVVPHRCARPGL